MTFKLIDAKKACVSVSRLCDMLGVSVSGYYAWRSRKASRRQRDDLVLLAHIRGHFARSRETYGSPRVHAELKAEGLRVGRHRVARLMRQNDLKALQKRRYKKTTDSEHASPVAPNLLDQDFTATGPNQKWGVDISYIWTAEGWLYLAIVLDLFSRRIIGWAVSDRLKKNLALSALRTAITLRRPSPGVIHHSDRGSQGRLKRSSQHPGRRCDGQTETELRSSGTGTVVVARSSAGGGTAGAAAVLDGDRGRLVQ